MNWTVTIIVAVMYIGMCYSLAEMSPALPHTGGAYSFGRTAMGPWGGFITGLAENHGSDEARDFRCHNAGPPSLSKRFRFPGSSWT